MSQTPVAVSDVPSNDDCTVCFHSIVALCIHLGLASSEKQEERSRMSVRSCARAAFVYKGLWISAGSLSCHCIEISVRIPLDHYQTDTDNVHADVNQDYTKSFILDLPLPLTVHFHCLSSVPFVVNRRHTEDTMQFLKFIALILAVGTALAVKPYCVDDDECVAGSVCCGVLDRQCCAKGQKCVSGFLDLSRWCEN